MLGSRDVRATGATDITELLEALAPQIGSARGRGGERPVLLLNGKRISSFREMRDIPTEAIERVEILPEEVALKYGYRADQRVVNIVLRERFRSTVARAEGSAATEGGYLGGEADATRLMISRDGRTTFNLRAEGNTALTEDERDIDQDSAPDDRSARTLIGSRKLLRGSTTVNRTVFTDVSATLNAEAEHNEGRSLIGLSNFALEPLVRNSDNDSAHVGVALNGDKGKWRWSATGNGDIARSVTRTDRNNQTSRDRSESAHDLGRHRPDRQRALVRRSRRRSEHDRARRRQARSTATTSSASRACPSRTTSAGHAEARARTSIFPSRAATATSARSGTSR